MLLSLTLLSIIIAILFALAKHRLNHWNRLGFPQGKPSFPFGDFGPVIRQQQSTADFYRTLYNRTKQQHTFIGMYIFLRPVLVINDPQLARDIMTRDFQHFPDHGIFVDEKRDPLSGHLFALTGERWQQLRAKLMPAFTPSRLREMFHIQLATGLTLQRYLEQFAESGEAVEMRDVFGRYATDAIASVAFGIEIDSIHNPNEEFHRIGKSVMQSNLGSFLRWTIGFLAPNLMKYTGLKLFSQEVEDFMLNLVRQTVEYREKNHISRKDILQLLLQVRNAGLVASNDSWNVDSTNNIKSLSMTEMTAAIFTFFIAGFETVSSAMAFCLNEITKNQNIQRKVQHEIDTALHQSNGKLTHDCITSMKYLDNCLNESLRKYPPVSFLNRVCTKAYPIHGTTTVIPEGTPILLPIYAFQRDADFFPHPDEFQPERFDTDQLTVPYHPFGEGPRQCIGIRMAKIKAKLGLALLMAKYDFHFSNPGDVRREAVMDPKYFLSYPKDGVHVVLTKR